MWCRQKRQINSKVLDDLIFGKYSSVITSSENLPVISVGLSQQNIRLKYMKYPRVFADNKKRKKEKDIGVRARIQTRDLLQGSLLVLALDYRCF